MSIEIFTVRHCDRCGVIMDDAWTVIRWKTDDLSDLCKTCTNEFNKWLKEAKKVNE